MTADKYQEIQVELTIVAHEALTADVLYKVRAFVIMLRHEWPCLHSIDMTKITIKETTLI